MSEMLREFPNNKNLCYKILKDKGKTNTAKKSIKKMNMQQFDGLLLDFGLTEEFRISVDLVFRELENSITLEYIFPDSLTNDQRKYIHLKCKALGFNSKSQGKEPHRKLRIWRANKTYQKVFHLEYNEEIEQIINSSLDTYTEVSKRNFHKNQNSSARCPQNDQVFGRLSSGNAVTIPEPVPNRLREYRKQLPVWFKKNEILELLEENQVLIISSETGSGKTTQVPQFILENACARGDSCKVICTQPRRLSTIAVAERVAAERGEKVGETVGYQIKLETRIGLKSALIYCTNGILLRTLMNSTASYLKNITHIIVDEIHERDKYTDFLLISLKRCLNNYPNLKVILMSATADVELFMSYFERAILLNIPGKPHIVQDLFLEDILMSLKDSNDNNAANGCNQTLYDIDVWRSENHRNQIPSNDPLNSDCDETYAALMEDMNNTVTKCVNEGLDDYFQELMMLILSEDGDVNYQTPNTGYTPLIAAAIHGNLEITRQLLHLGADASLKSGSLTASEWAEYYNKHEVRDMINRYNMSNENYGQQLQPENLLENYDRTVSHEAIDFSLIVKIITQIHETDKHGTILVFLPGYDDITNCLQNIMAASSIESKEFEIFMLHSSMNIKAQHRVFEEAKTRQKIILSTNIAETSITIADVVYVIDTGRAKEKTYDTISGTCSLQTVWISKASVKQRAGRAGRTQAGVCFRLFSRKRYVSMLNNRIPEMLRVPLHELCLQTKLLAPSELKIADYLGLALEPPSSLSVENAIRGLKELGALKENEELTSLGEHLVQLSVEPRLGKMLIYAIIFKCLDPILTIVACLSSKDPFTLPQNPRQKQMATEKQKQLTSDSLSDHVAFLRAYQFWQQAEVSIEDNLIKEFYINSATMQTIHETRSQLLSQLRGAGFITMQKPLSVQDANINSSHWPIIKAVLAVGYYPNIAFGQNNNFATRMEKKIIFHKCSCLNVFTNDKTNCQKRINNYCVIFEELSKIGRHCSIKCGTAVTPFTVALFCGAENKNFEPHNLTIDEYLNFQHGYDRLALFCLSVKTIISHKIANPRYISSSAEKEILNALQRVLSIEEQQHELLIQPTGVGLIPKLFSSQQMFGGSHRRRNDYNQRRSDSYQQHYDPSQQHCNFNGRQWEPRRNTHNRRPNNFRNEVVGGSSDMILNGLNTSHVQSLHVSSNSGHAGNRIHRLSERAEDNLGRPSSLNAECLNNFSGHLSTQAYHTQNASSSNLSDMFLNGLNIRSSSSPCTSSDDGSCIRLSSNVSESSEPPLPNITEHSLNAEHVNDFNRYLPSGSSKVQYNIPPLRQNELATLQEKTNAAQSSSSFNRFPQNENLQDNVDNLSDVLLQALTGPKFCQTNHSQMDFNIPGTSENLHPTNATDIVPIERLDLPLYTAFFVIKPPDYNSFRMGISLGTWIFSPQTERKIFRFVNQGYFVVLFFSISKTQEFQGLARLRSVNDGSNLACPIQWLSTMPIPYRRIRARNLTNLLDGDKLLFQCVDGQQVEFNAGRQLCCMFFEPAPRDEQHFSRAILGNTNK